MKFGQLVIVYNVTDIFLQKSYANHTEKLFPDLFLKNQDSAYLLFYSFIVWQTEGYRNILKLGCKPLAFIS